MRRFLPALILTIIGISLAVILASREAAVVGDHLVGFPDDDKTAIFYDQLSFAPYASSQRSLHSTTVWLVRLIAILSDPLWVHSPFVSQPFFRFG